MNLNMRVLEEIARTRSVALLNDAENDRLSKEGRTVKPALGIHLQLSIGNALVSIDLNLKMWGRATDEQALA